MNENNLPLKSKQLFAHVNLYKGFLTGVTNECKYDAYRKVPGKILKTDDITLDRRPMQRL